MTVCCTDAFDRHFISDLASLMLVAVTRMT